MTLFKSEHHSQRRISMTGELRSSRPKAGAKRGSNEAFRCDYEKEYDTYPDDDQCDRVLDYQRVPASVMSVPAAESSPVKRARPCSSSSSSSSTAALRPSSNRPASRSSDARTGPTAGAQAKLKMAELLAIKRELTVIKVQIDGLLDCVDKMDRQRKDRTESPPPTREGSMAADSPPYRGGSLSSLDNSPVSHLSHRQRDGSLDNSPVSHLSHRQRDGSLDNSPVSHLSHRQRDSPEPGEACSDDDDQPRYHHYYYHHHYSHHRINNHHSDLEDDM